MLKTTYFDARNNRIDIHENQEKSHVVVTDSSGTIVTEVVLDAAGEAHTWAKRQGHHALWDERGQH